MTKFGAASLGALAVSLAAPAMAEPLALTHVTVIDATGRAPIEDAVIVMDKGRVVSIGPAGKVKIPAGATVIDKRGKFVIPGLMDANVHLQINIDLDTLLRLRERYADIIVEGSQIALKSGLTTVFDTWGPLPDLQEARRRINDGKAIGARIYFAGNIIGFNGPASPDFFGAYAGMLNKNTVQYINSRWVQGLGPELVFDTDQELYDKVDTYARKDVDFLKYASNSHTDFGLIMFTDKMQSAIVRAGHASGKTVQAHVHSIAGMESAIGAGADILTHCDITPERTIPLSVIKSMRDRKISCSVLPVTKAYQAVQPAKLANFYVNSWTNIKNLVDQGVNVMLSTDAGIDHPLPVPEPEKPVVDNRTALGQGHFFALAAMEQLGIDPMKMLQIATINVAKGYKMEKLLGTIEPGKYADMVVLDANPLEAAANYRKIDMVIKDGAVVDLKSLPSAPLISNQVPLP